MVNLSDIKLDLPEFVPIFKIETAHSQTLLGHLIKSLNFTEPGQQMFLNLPDGDQMSLKIFENKSAQKKNKVVTLFHGLAGDHTSDYIQRTARLAFDLGYSVVTVDHRGAGLAEGLAKRPYHSGRGEDASEVSLKLRDIFPLYEQIFVGFSLSGSVVLNLVTQRYGKHLPDYAITVNAPINLQAASDHLIKGFSRIYDLRFYFTLRRLILRFEPDFKIPRVSNTRLIDNLFTSIKSGFADASDYYTKCSTYKYLDQVSVPTFVLTSKDDPFIAFTDYKTAKWNNLTHRTFIDYGGHMGYISKHKAGLYGRRWLDDYIHHVLNAIEAI